MRVARVRVHAPVTSFRHPFFVTGAQPSFAMPPPSTVHGHCASALGHWPDPSTFFFGIHFTFSARTRDLEHQHIASALPTKTRLRVPTDEGEAPATTEIGVQPVLQRVQPVAAADAAGHGHDLVVGRVRVAVADVVPDGAREQERHLLDDPQVLPVRR